MARNRYKSSRKDPKRKLFSKERDMVNFVDTLLPFVMQGNWRAAKTKWKEYVQDMFDKEVQPLLDAKDNAAIEKLQKSELVDFNIQKYLDNDCEGIADPWAHPSYIAHVNFYRRHPFPSEMAERAVGLYVDQGNIDRAQEVALALRPDGELTQDEKDAVVLTCARSKDGKYTAKEYGIPLGLSPEAEAEVRRLTA